MARKQANDQTVSAKGAAPAATQGAPQQQTATAGVESQTPGKNSAPTQADPAADNAATEALMQEPVLRVTAKPRQGFRRCGIHHPAEATDHPAGRFSAIQIKLLKAEPNLIVEDL